MTAKIGTDLNTAASCLRAGQLVAIPTETVYGLAANGLDSAAVAQIFVAKARPSFDPLILHVAKLEQLERLVDAIPEQAKQLATAFWPGPLTMVFRKKAVVPDMVTAGLDSVAVRLPRHPMALALLEQLDFPLAAPSANPFGYVSPTNAQHVQQQLGDKIAYILDGGPCEIGLESSIVSFAGSEPLILRKGGIAIEDIFACLGRPIGVQTHSNSRPAAPGMLDKHYSPHAAFRLGVYPPAQKAQRTAYIVFGREAPSGEADVYNLSSTGDLAEAARVLFALLRDLDQQDYQTIVAQLLPEEGLGRAINDRLRRAAAS